MVSKERKGFYCKKCDNEFKWFAFREATKKDINAVAEWEVGIPYEPKTKEDWKYAELCILPDHYSLDRVVDFDWAEEPCKECKKFIKESGIDIEW